MSIGLSERISDDRLGAVLLQNKVQRLDPQCLQRRVPVKGQLAQRSEAIRVDPDQQAARVSLDPRLMALC